MTHESWQVLACSWVSTHSLVPPATREDTSDPFYREHSESTVCLAHIPPALPGYRVPRRGFVPAEGTVGLRHLLSLQSVPPELANCLLLSFEGKGEG